MPIFRQEMLARSQVLAVPAKGNEYWQFGVVLSPVAVIMQCPSVAPQLLLWAPVEVGGDGRSLRGSRQPLFPLFAHHLGAAHFAQNFPGKSWLCWAWLGYKAIFREANSRRSIFNFHLDRRFIFYLLILL